MEKFFSGPSNRHYTCTYPSRTYENGVIHMAGTCIDKKGRKIGVEVNGTYTPTSFELRAFNSSIIRSCSFTSCA